MPFRDTVLICLHKSRTIVKEGAMKYSSLFRGLTVFATAAVLMLVFMITAAQDGQTNEEALEDEAFVQFVDED